MLFAKEPAAVEVYNDINAGLANFFRVIQDPVLFADFCRRINFTLYSRAEYEHFRKTWETIEDPLERAFRFYVVARQSFGGMFGKSWGYALTLENGGMSAVNSKWLSIMRMMPEIQKRLATVKIECRSWREVLKDYESPDYFIYLDPPYVAETRKGGEYADEMTNEAHTELVEVILRHPAMIVLSGYNNGLYDPLGAAGWDIRNYDTVCYAVGKTRGTGILGIGSALKMQKRTETVWRNPAAMKAVKSGERQLSLLAI